VLTRREAWSVALVATLTMTVSYIDRSTLAVLAPTVTKELHISETAYGWLTSAFSIAYLIGTPLSGLWIDRIGARRGLVWSVLLWTMVAALHAIVPGFGMLFALRIALGLAEGPSFPGSTQTIQRVLPDGDKERGFGVLFTGSSIGGMLAPVLASALFAVAGWRLAFVGTAIAGLVWLPLWLWVTRRPEVRARMDAPRELVENPSKASFGELVVHPLTLRALCSIAAVAPIVGVALGWGAKYMAATFAVPQEAMGKYLWLPPLMFDASAVLFGDLASRWKHAQKLLYAIAIPMGASLALLPYAPSPWLAVVIIGVAMAGNGAVYTLTTADMLHRVPAANVSTMSGIVAGAQSLALIISNPLIGWSVKTHGDYDIVAWTIGLWVIPGCLVWLLWKPRHFSHARY
jgi:ACS family hexuronate transporter-like MFS transporter